MIINGVKGLTHDLALKTLEVMSHISVEPNKTLQDNVRMFPASDSFTNEQYCAHILTHYPPPTGNVQVTETEVVA
ncbi:hypothetical protein ACYPKM_02325 [Pseudomonas aeruginosa]